MANIDVYLEKEKIEQRLEELAGRINADYAGQSLVVVAVLNGTFIFCADLLRKIKVPVQVEFMAASSYEDGTASSGHVEIKLDLKKSISGQNVLVMEDIVDTGHTLSKILPILKARGAKSLKVCSLLHKPSRTVVPIEIDYLGFEIEDKFVIGYGLDYAGRYRELPYIGIYRE